MRIRLFNNALRKLADGSVQCRLICTCLSTAFALCLSLCALLSNLAALPAWAESSCLPFFDDIDNPVKVNWGGVQDITPPAPIASDFDRAVNQICGPPGKEVSTAEFKALMNSNTDVLDAIQKFTGGKVFADRITPYNTAAYLNDLTAVWFNLQGFEHILCGELKDGDVDGLHFWGRYLDLQEKGLACRLPNLSRAEVLPGAVYTMGVQVKLSNGIAESPIKGYGLTLSAADILKAGTRAFLENPTRNTYNTACILSIEDDGKTFKNVFVRQARGIRTFYPDATPGGAPCKAKVVLSVEQSLQTELPVVENRAPVVGPIADRTVVVDNLTEFTLSAGMIVDPDGDEFLVDATLVGSEPLPYWLDFDPETLTFYALPEPEDEGVTISIEVIAYDGEEFGQTEFEITVLPQLL